MLQNTVRFVRIYSNLLTAVFYPMQKSENWNELFYYFMLIYDVVLLNVCSINHERLYRLLFDSKCNFVLYIFNKNTFLLIAPWLLLTASSERGGLW